MAEKKKNFEESMHRIEEIVSLLERGDAKLEESIALFDEGTKLIQGCSGLLDKAEQKVQKLLITDEKAAAEVPFDEG
ncbi:MAG: exodeoxyribonuclease VII small subunit [Oscillospiraceae bacterium]|nr:exodeoxyribonuclease VII small subunit [Oscillospiraceae bacterium]